jgi:hypothetical protein
MHVFCLSADVIWMHQAWPVAAESWCMSLTWGREAGLAAEELHLELHGALVKLHQAICA